MRLFAALLFLIVLYTSGCTRKVVPVAQNENISDLELADPRTTMATSFGEPVASHPFGAELFVPSRSMSAEKLIENLRAAFPDKALYLDFWAVWCGPCLSQFPFSASLHGEAHDLDVEFVYLCTAYGGDEERWQQKIVENRLPGTHLFLSKSAHIKIMDMFNGRGYPTYAVVRTDGKIKKNVSRPSNLDHEKLAKLIRVKQ